MNVKNKKFELAKELLSHPKINQMLAEGIITESIIRNCSIIVDYHDLREEYNHLDSLAILSGRYFLSGDRLLSILYKKK